MYQKQIFKQMFNLNKAAVDNSLSSLIMIQNQMEGLANTMLKNAAWIPEEGKKALNEWVEAYKKGREDFKNQVNENYKKVEDFLSSSL